MTEEEEFPKVPTCWDCGSKDVRESNHRYCWDWGRFGGTAFVGTFFGLVVLGWMAMIGAWDESAALHAIRRASETLELSAKQMERETVALRATLVDSHPETKPVAEVLSCLVGLEQRLEEIERVR